MKKFLSETNPELAKEWHPTKNTIKPTEITSGSSKRVWWQCQLDHEWQATINQRRKCPVCSNRKILAGYNDLASQKPELVKEWHPTKNTIKPTEIGLGSSKRVWWQCQLDHEWQAQIRARTKNGQGCPVCINQKILAGYNDLASQKPELVKEWHPTKNTIKPTEIGLGSSKRVWWQCQLGHEWQAEVRSQKMKLRCPTCANQKVVVDYNDLASQKPELAKEWHPTKNTIKPTEIGLGSSKRVWWQCQLGHEWQAKSCDRQRGTSCPVCANQKVVAGYNDLASQKPELAKEWHPTKNTIKPTEIGLGSNIKVWWQCKLNHKWKTSVANRNSGTTCPKCHASTSHAENEIANYLETLGVKIDRSNKEIINPLELDIFIPELQIAIEYNGLYWHSEKHKKKEYHYNKWKKCNEKNIQLIQIWEDEWKLKKEIVETMLAHKMNKSQKPKVYGRNTTIKEIDYQKSAFFLDRNHIQGKTNGTFYLSLQQNNNIHAVMVIKKISNQKWELVRYASDSQVIGGFSKLLSYFEKNYEWKEIKSFADLCVSDGNVYDMNGFSLSNTLPPDYKYIISHKREHKFKYRLKKFKTDPDLLWEEGMSEKQLAEINGLLRIYDAGKQKWVKTNKAF